MQFSDSAEATLERYMESARREASRLDADPDEVEQSLREHLALELSGVPMPVCERELAAALDRLGSPSGWSEDSPGEVPRERSWSLAVAAFALTLGGVWMAMTFDVPPILVLVGFVLARLAMRLPRDTEHAAAQRWLLYPPLILVDLAALSLLVVGPLFPLQEIIGRSLEARSGAAGVALEVLIVVACMAIWLGALLWAASRSKSFVQAVFVPIFDRFNTSLARRASHACLACSGCLAAVSGLLLSGWV